MRKVCHSTQLSYGLSSEYSKSPAAEKTDSEKVDADRQLYAKYYVSQIMQMGEEGIRDAWSKVIVIDLRVCQPLCILGVLARLSCPSGC